jgi:hypothetical protein
LYAWETVTQWHVAPEGGAEQTRIQDNAILATIDSALTGQPQEDMYTFHGTNLSPFRGHGTPKVRNRVHRPSSSRSSHVLSLNGILHKNEPLAIIRDEAGTTHICHTGDTVYEYVVRAIGRDNVRLQCGSLDTTITITK